LKTVLIVSWLTLAGAIALVMRSHQQGNPDPLSGIWTGDWGTTPTHRHSVTLELKWEGKTVTGTVNPGPHGIRVADGRFDVRASAVHLEIDASSMGRAIHYVVNGIVENRTMIGTWRNEKNRGNFRLMKK